MTEKNFEICLLPELKGMGGPVSFSRWMIKGLEERGIKVSHDPQSPSCKVILLNGGMSRMDKLWLAKRRGVKIVQRLNGMNWLHKKGSKFSRYYWRAEFNNWVLSTIRKNLTDKIIYQSNFSRDWWQTVYKPVRADGAVVYNGTDLTFFFTTGRRKTT